MNVTRDTGVALMAAWLGAATLTSASVAPAAFAALPSRTLAGDVVGRVLAVVFVSGIVLGAVCLFLNRRATMTTRASLGVTVLACIVAQFVVNPQIAGIRAELGGTGVDALSLADPRRLQFGRLHGISVALLGLAMISALVFVVLSLLAPQRSPESVNG